MLLVDANKKLRGLWMNISASIRRLANLFMLLFIALSGALVYWQVVVAKDVAANPHNGRACMQENSPIRGNIYDRNGVPLAWSVSDPTVYCGYKRVYKEPSLAGLIGYYAGPNYTSTGIEKEYDDYLSGRNETGTLENAVSKVLHRPPFGYDIYLTIDIRVQQTANQSFDTPANPEATNRGSIVISNPHTGEILAMVSRPGYDPNKLVDQLMHNNLTYFTQLDTNPEQPLVFRPLERRYSPGSVYKTMTLIAALDTGAATLGQKFTKKQAQGPVVIGGETFGPVGNNITTRTVFPITTEFGFTYSDNIIFAQLGAATGPEKWLEYNKRFYVGSNIPFDLPSATSQVLPAGKTELELNQLGENAFGQGTDNVTPFTMSLIDNAVANDGVLMRPMLVSKVTLPAEVTKDNPRPRVSGDPPVQKPDKAQDVQTFAPRQLAEVMKQQTAVEVRRGMYGVLYCGTGAFARNLFWEAGDSAVIGKTGTAEVRTSNADKTLAHGWMITQAPYNISQPEKMPALTIISMKENSGSGGSVNGPMLENMYNNIFSKGYVKADVPSLPIDASPLPQNSKYCLQNDLTLR
jgi:peptidoglycan glycosyltransferase